jgi:hypothetical protein
MRATLRDLLYCFGKYSGARVFYLNLAIGRLPWYLRTISFDLIIFHTLFLNSHWQAPRFAKLIRKVEFLKDNHAVKIVLPQDEFHNPKVICRFINEFDIKHIFSVQPECEWKNIYREIDFSKVQIHRVLTGYIDDDMLHKIAQKKKKITTRDITIGYRTLGNTHKNYSWYGRHGLLKVKIADLFQKAAPEKGIKSDISYDEKDIINGDKWYWFLLRCKYVLGTEGGTSILDWDGRIHKRTANFVKDNPDTDFDEIERNCFAGLDGTFQGFAISPRHLEACATETCQILTEGEYNGILKPNLHYIELKKDFSNLESIIAHVISDDKRKEITKRAFEDIVLSGKYTYTHFTKFLIATALGHLHLPGDIARDKFWETIVFHWMKFADRIKWVVLFFIYQGYRIIRRLKRFNLYNG